MKKIFVILFTAVLFMININNSEYVYATQHTVAFSLPLKFKWGHSGLVRGQKYKVTLKALQENTPMPEKSLKKEYTKTVPENETKELFPPITYTRTGDYEYEIRLIRGSNIVLKTYYLHIQVLNQGNGELFITTTIHKNTKTGAKVTEIRFMDIGDDENLYDKDPKHNNHSSNESSHEREEEYLREKNKNHQSTSETKTSKSSITKSRTGDEKKVEMYLFLSIISLGIILVIGCKKISGRR